MTNMTCDKYEVRPPVPQKIVQHCPKDLTAGWKDLARMCLPNYQIIHICVQIDELRRKYSGDRVEKHINNKDEQLAIAWFRKKLSLDLISETG